MATEIKNILIHLSVDEYRRLKAIKQKQSWKELLISTLQNKLNKIEE